MSSRHFLTGIIVTLFSIALLACGDRKEETATLPRPAETPPATMLKAPFKDPIEPALYELPSGALATWRDYAKYRPALILYAGHPLLQPIPDQRRTIARDLLHNGTGEEIISRARTLNANAAILPPEAVSAAIDSKLFSELLMVLPNREKPESIKLSELRNKLLSAEFLTAAEVEKLSLKDGVVSGTVRGLPLRILHPERLPQTTTPVIIHIDLSYFSEMYINEVKTPAYDLLHQLAISIGDAGYHTLAATLSFSNQEVGLSLESRFLIRDLGTLLRKPSFLKGDTPPSWSLRAQALHATTMFSEEHARSLTRQAAAIAKDDAAAYYALALDQFEQHLATEGFSSLDSAVALDSGYGLEYLNLAERGIRMGKRDKSIELLEKASRALPANSFVRMELANQLIQASRVKEARPIIAELQKLDWSEALYPDVPSYLKQMADAAAVDVIPPLTPPAPPAGQGQGKRSMPGFNHMGMGGHPGR